MTARRNQSQRQLFYELRLDEVVPDNHLVRKIQALLDLSWVYAGVAPYYSKIGSPSIDPGSTAYGASRLPEYAVARFGSMRRNVTTSVSSGSAPST